MLLQKISNISWTSGLICLNLLDAARKLYVLLSSSAEEIFVKRLKLAANVSCGHDPVDRKANDKDEGRLKYWLTSCFIVVDLFLFSLRLCKAIAHSLNNAGNTRRVVSPSSGCLFQQNTIQFLKIFPVTDLERRYRQHHLTPHCQSVPVAARASTLIGATLGIPYRQRQCLRHETGVYSTSTNSFGTSNVIMPVLSELCATSTTSTSGPSPQLNGGQVEQSGQSCTLSRCAISESVLGWRVQFCCFVWSSANFQVAHRTTQDTEWGCLTRCSVASGDR